MLHLSSISCSTEFISPAADSWSYLTHRPKPIKTIVTNDSNSAEGSLAHLSGETGDDRATSHPRLAMNLRVQYYRCLLLQAQQQVRGNILRPCQPLSSLFGVDGACNPEQHLAPCALLAVHSTPPTFVHLHSNHIRTGKGSQCCGH